MTDTQKQAIDAIRNATGWNAQPFVNGAQTESNDGPRMSVFWSEFYGSWCCQVTLFVSWISHGDTPEVAIADVLTRYRAHIAALAADILPGWPRLEWGNWEPFQPVKGMDRAVLTLHAYGCVRQITAIYRKGGVVSAWEDASTYWCNETTDEVSEDVAAYVKSLALPCSLPPFPGSQNV